MPQTPDARWSPAIRRLHLAVALLVTIQLVIGLVMSRHTLFLVTTHFYVGLTIATIVLLHWAWLLARERSLLRYLFPWTPARLAAALREGLEGMRGTLPRSGPASAGLAGLVHGLGLLALTAVAALGTTIFILVQLGLARTHLAGIVEDLHVTFAWILIVYWGGHVLLATIHEARGDHVIARIFRPERT